MQREELAGRIDHAALGPGTTPGEVRDALDAAREHGMNACIPSCYVAEAAEYAPDVRLVTVVGFPHGLASPAVLVEEAETAWADGADELDVVMNAGRLHAGEDDRVQRALAEVVASVPVPVKVIVETALLTPDELDRAARLAAAAGADMLKTSTGFAGGGATVADVDRLSAVLPVKASGGVRTYRKATALLEAGAERIGTSTGPAILADAPAD